MKIQKNSGNIFFLMLLVIGLFTALTLTVMNSTPLHDNFVSTEKTTLAAGGILEHMNAIKGGVDRLRYGRGCKREEIDFYNIGSAYYTGNRFYAGDVVPANRRCSVYHPDGAGIAALTLPKDAGLMTAGVSQPAYAYAYLPYHVFIEDVGRNYDDATGHDAEELVITAHFLNEKVCRKFNALVDFGIAGAAPPVVPAYIMSQEGFISSGGGVKIDNRTNPYPQFKGKQAGCFYADYSGAYYTAPHYIAYLVLAPG